VGSTGSTNFTINGLKPNTSYIFGVKAAAPGGTTGYKDTGAVTLPRADPDEHCGSPG